MAVAAPAYTPIVLEIAVNGGRASDAVIVLRGTDGALLLPSATLRALNIRLADAAVVTIDGEAYVRLADLAGFASRIDEAAQRLDLKVPAEAFEGGMLVFADADQGPMTPSATGFFLNYDLVGQIAGKPIMNGMVELGIFSGAQFGQATAIAHWLEGGIGATRLDTSWTLDFPAQMRSLRFGDSISSGGVGGAPLRFGGIQFGRNFAAQPGFVTLPVPSLSSSSALPSVVDLYVNGALLGSRAVASGPFTISDAPIVTGSGELSMVVRDALGRETVVRQSYYAAPRMLRAGLHDYSYELGFLRRAYLRKSFSYGAPMASATHRLGISNRLTVEAHGEASAKTQAVGIAADLALPGIGLVSASAAASRSEQGTGSQLGVGLERRAAGVSFSARADYSSLGYRNLGMADERPAPRLTVQLFAGLPTRFGSVGASYLLRDSHGEGPDAEYLSANASIRVGGIGTFHLAGRKGLRDKGELAVQAFLTIALRLRASAYLGLRRDDRGPLATAGFQKNAPAGEGWGYRAAATLGAVDRLDVHLGLNTAFGEYDADLSYTDGKVGSRIVASGAIAAVGGEVFASRRLSQGFAMVSAGGHENVRVYADNHLVARTNKNGKAIAPRLRAYERNIVRIEFADLPLDTVVAGGEERIVRPFARSGVVLDFDARRSRSALLRIEVEGLGTLPAGADVRVQGRSFLSAPGGEVFLTDMADTNLVEASWPGGRCSFILKAPPSDDPQPDLGSHACSAAQMAASQ